MGVQCGAGLRRGQPVVGVGLLLLSVACHGDAQVDRSEPEAPDASTPPVASAVFAPPLPRRVWATENPLAWVEAYATGDACRASLDGGSVRAEGRTFGGKRVRVVEESGGCAKVMMGDGVPRPVSGNLGLQDDAVAFVPSATLHEGYDRVPPKDAALPDHLVELLRPLPRDPFRYPTIGFDRDETAYHLDFAPIEGCSGRVTLYASLAGSDCDVALTPAPICKPLLGGLTELGMAGDATWYELRDLKMRGYLVQARPAELRLFTSGALCRDLSEPDRKVLESHGHPQPCWKR